MSADAEVRAARAVARLAEECEELAVIVTVMLGKARAAGLDPGATRGLVGAALALGANHVAVYAAGRGMPLRYAYPSEREFMNAIADAEDDLGEARRAARQIVRVLTRLARAAERDLDDGRKALDNACAMLVEEPCDGCHGRREAAIEAAQETIRDAEERLEIIADTAEALSELDNGMRYAEVRLQNVPADLGETYESVYNLIRSGGRMPREGRWITGGTPGGERR